MNASREADAVVAEFARLQSILVAEFLRKYHPKDTLRFLDVPPGSLVCEGTEWKQFRHGVGVTFSSHWGEVNAAVGMLQNPNGVDADRLCQYMESIELSSIRYRGDERGVDREAVERLLQDMAHDGILTRVECTHPFLHVLYVPQLHGHGPA